MLVSGSSSAANDVTLYWNFLRWASNALYDLLHIFFNVRLIKVSKCRNIQKIYHLSKCGIWSEFWKNVQNQWKLQLINQLSTQLSLNLCQIYYRPSPKRAGGGLRFQNQRTNCSVFAQTACFCQGLSINYSRCLLFLFL